MPHGAGLALVDHREHAVIRRDEVMLFARYQNGPALGADAGIDDHHVNRARRKVLVGVGDAKARRPECR